MGMAIEAPSGTNGVEAAAPTEGTAPTSERSKMTRAEQDTADRDAFLAGSWDNEPEEAPKAKKVESKKPAASDEDDAEVEALEEAVEEEEDDVDLEDDEDDESEDEEEADEDDTSEKEKADPEQAKRIASVRKMEKRVREQAAARDARFEQERNAFVAEWKPKIAEYEKFEQLKARKYDVLGVLKAVGYTDDELEYVAQTAYGHSKAGAADPKYREHAKRLMTERELRDEAAAARREAAEVKDMLTKRDEQAERDRQVDAYREKIIKSAADLPLMKKRLEQAPKATRLAIDKLALEQANKTGKLVDAKKIARLYEKKLERAVARVKALAGDDTPAVDTKKTAPIKAKAAAIKVIDRTKTDEPVKAKTNGHSVIPTRDDMIDRLHKLDRGELDPDAD